MIGRRATVGLSLLLVLTFSAFAAQSASAQKGTKAVNTTAVTCVKGGGSLDFKDPHCDEFVGKEKGEYGHVAIQNDGTTELEVSQEGTSTFTFPVEFGDLQVLCKKVVSVPGKSFIHNVLSEGTKHTVTGTVQLNFSSCEVKNFKGCVVKEPFTLTATFEGVEGLNPTTKVEMGLEFAGEGEKGTFTEIAFADKGAEKCGIGSLPVSGAMIATGNAKNQSEKYGGATWRFETGPESNRMGTLMFGNRLVTFTGTFIPQMAGGGNPISLTTVT